MAIDIDANGGMSLELLEEVGRSDRNAISGLVNGSLGGPPLVQVPAQPSIVRAAAPGRRTRTVRSGPLGLSRSAPQVWKIRRPAMVAVVPARKDVCRNGGKRSFVCASQCGVLRWPSRVYSANTCASSAASTLSAPPVALHGVRWSRACWWPLQRLVAECHALFAWGHAAPRSALLVALGLADSCQAQSTCRLHWLSDCQSTRHSFYALLRALGRYGGGSKRTRNALQNLGGRMCTEAQARATDTNRIEGNIIEDRLMRLELNKSIATDAQIARCG